MKAVRVRGSKGARNFDEVATDEIQTARRASWTAKAPRVRLVRGAVNADRDSAVGFEPPLLDGVADGRAGVDVGAGIIVSGVAGSSIWIMPSGPEAATASKIGNDPEWAPPMDTGTTPTPPTLR